MLPGLGNLIACNPCHATLNLFNPFCVRNPYPYFFLSLSVVRFLSRGLSRVSFIRVSEGLSQGLICVTNQIPQDRAICEGFFCGVSNSLALNLPDL